MMMSTTDLASSAPPPPQLMPPGHPPPSHHHLPPGPPPPGMMPPHHEPVDHRKMFFDRLTAFNEERGYSNNTSPTISKQPLDLFVLYNAVKARGGFAEVSRQKLWKECATICNLTINSSAAYTLKKQYIKHLLPFECKYDRGDIEVQLVLSQAEATTKSNSKSKGGGNSGKGSAPSPGPSGDSNSQGSISSASNSSYPGDGGSRSTPGPPPVGSYYPDANSTRTPGPPGPPPSQSQVDNSPYPKSQQQQPPTGYPYGASHPSYHQQQGPIPPQMTGGYGPPPHHQPPHSYGQPPPQSPHDPSSPWHHHPSQGQQHPNASGYGPPPGSQTPVAPPPHSSHSMNHPSQAPSQPTSHHRPPPPSQGGPPTTGDTISAQHPFSDEAQQQQQSQPPSAIPPPSSYGQQPPSSVNGYSSQQYRPTPPGPPQHPHMPPSQYGQPHQPQNPRGYPDYRDNRAYGPPPGDQSRGYGPRPGGPPQQQQPGQYPPGNSYHQQMTPTPTGPSSYPDSNSTRTPGPPGPPTQAQVDNSPYPKSQQQQPTGYPYGSSHPTYHQQGPPQATGGYGPPPPSTSSYGPPPTHHQPPPHSGYGHPPPPPQSPHDPSSSWHHHPSQQHPPSSGYGQTPVVPPHSSHSMPPSHPPQQQPSPQQASSQPPSHHRPPPPTSQGGPPPPSTGDSVSAQHPFSDEVQQQSQPPPSSYGQQPPSSVNGYSGQQYRPTPPGPPQHPHMPPTQYGQPQQPPPQHPRGYPDFRDNRGYGPPPGDQVRGYGPRPGGPHGAQMPPGPPPQQQPGQYPPGHPSYHQQMRYPKSPVPPHMAGPRGPAMQHPGMAPGPGMMPVPPQHHPQQPYIPTGHGPVGYGHPPGQGMMAGHPPVPSGPMIPPKKEIVFPPGSIEAAQPVLVKRRKINSRDLSGIDSWRLLMCLKSGLLAESTWALDILSVLAYDESTFNCFVLNGMPGLLDTILEHFKKYLEEMFEGLLDVDHRGRRATRSWSRRQLTSGSFMSRTKVDTDSKAKDCDQQPATAVDGQDCSTDRPSSPSCHRYKIRRSSKSRGSRSRKWYEIDEDVKENSEPMTDGHLPNGILDGPEVEPSVAEPQQPTKDIPCTGHQLVKAVFPLSPKSLHEMAQKLILLNGSLNFTLKSRDGKPVKIVKNGNLTPSQVESRWRKMLMSATLEPAVKKVRAKMTVEGKDEEVIDDDSWMTDSGHILTNFAPKEKYVRFCHLTKSAEAQHPETAADNPEAKLVNGSTNKQVTCDPEEVESEVTFPRLLNKRKRQHDLFDDLEEESFHKDHPPLYPIDEYWEQLGRRCLSLSTLLRNFSFVPNNELEMARHQELLLVLSRLLMLNHEHPKKVRSYENKGPSIDPDSLFSEVPSDEAKTEVTVADLTDDTVEDDDFGGGKDEWYWETMHLLLENTLVTLANISGQLDVSPFPEDISLPLLDGLLHWAVCPSSYAQDQLPNTNVYSLTPQRLAIETLVKLSIRDCNVDLILATPPWERLDRLFKNAAKMLARNEDQTVREFSLVILANFASADTGIARTVALTGNAIPQLIGFVEQAEHSAMSVAQHHGVQALRENPELMGTTLDMVRRAAYCLRTLSRIPENRPLFSVYQQRLLSLVMSQILDQGVAGILADVMYETSLSDPSGPKEVFLPYLQSSVPSFIGQMVPPPPQLPVIPSNPVVKSEETVNEPPSADISPAADDLKVDGQSGPTSPVTLEVTKMPIPHSEIVMNGIDKNNHDEPKMEDIPIVPTKLTNHQMKEAPVVNNNSSGDPTKQCPRLKELLLSYQSLSPSSRFEGGSSTPPATLPIEQVTE